MRFRGVETKEVHELAMVLSIFVNTKIDVLAECLVKLGVYEQGKKTRKLTDDYCKGTRFFFFFRP